MADDRDLTPPAAAFDWGGLAPDPIDVLTLPDSETATAEALALVKIYREMTQRLLVRCEQQTRTIRRLTERLRERVRG
jgi:hypothetical protein